MIYGSKQNGSNHMIYGSKYNRLNHMIYGSKYNRSNHMIYGSKNHRSKQKFHISYPIQCSFQSICLKFSFLFLSSIT